MSTTATNNNKVEYGLDDVHYAIVTLNDDGSPVYGPWIAEKNAQTLTDENQTASLEVHADNRCILTCRNITSKNLSLGMSIFSDEFKIKVLSFIETSTGSLIECTNPEPVYIALGLRVQGDAKNRKLVFPLVQVLGYTSGENKTVEGTSITPQTPKVELKAMPLLFDAVNEKYFIIERFSKGQDKYATLWDTVYTLPTPKTA